MVAERILVVGAGVVGASVAYHLTGLGHEAVTVGDARSREAFPGSTGLAPGFVGQLSATPELAVLARDSVATYRALSEGAEEPAFHQVGCLEIATSAARLDQAHQDVEHGRSLGIEARVLDAAEAVALAPALVDAERVLGALYIPSDGAADPTALTRALVDAAGRQGADFRWRTPVTALETENGRVVGVRTGDTVLKADRVVLATGVWGPVLAADAGVRLPMVDVQHPYVFTAELPGLDDTPIDAPIVRYPDQTVYTRRHGRRYGLGSYAHTPLPLTPDAALTSAERPFAEADFGTAIQEALAMVPAFRGAPRGHALNGVFAMTPDEIPLVGPAPTAPGLWFAEASWVTHAGGVGRQLAHMLLDSGDPLVDPGRLAPSRFDDWSDAKVRETALANYRGIYDAHWAGPPPGMIAFMAEITLMSDPRVAAVRVEECGERLVDVREEGALLVDGRKHDGTGAFAHLREGVLARLLLAQSRLPEGLRLLYVEGYRPPSLQRRYFEEYGAELRAAHPEWSAADLYAAASRYVSPPEIAPHSAGSAVDLTLADADGRELDLGTRMNASPEESAGACYTEAVGISVEARRNRENLGAALTAAGLVNYPTEWWHWSFGDRYWALATGAPAALYGPKEL